MDFFNRRRNYFVDKRVQGLWALLNLIIAAIIALAIGAEILWSFYVELGWPLASRPFTIPDLIFVIKLVILAVVGGGCFWLLSAFTAHRIAGPIYKLNKSLKEVAQGNYHLRIQFRRKDFFHDVADSFNEMTAAIEKQIDEKNNEIEELKKKINTT